MTKIFDLLDIAFSPLVIMPYVQTRNLAQVPLHSTYYKMAGILYFS